MNSQKGAADEINRLKWLIKIRSAIIIVEFLAILILGGLALYFGTLPKTLPWVVELSNEGDAIYRGDVVKTLNEWSPSDATQRYFISRYVSEMRSVSTDNNINKEQANSVYSRTVGNATATINSWFTSNNPVTRSKNEYVIIPYEEMAVVKYSDNQWKVTWRETSYRNSDNMIFADQQIEAVFTVEFYLPDTERRRRDNPIGMYVSNIETVYEKSLI